MIVVKESKIVIRNLLDFSMIAWPASDQGLLSSRGKTLGTRLGDIIVKSRNDNKNHNIKHLLIIHKLTAYWQIMSTIICHVKRLYTL
jgi:hypothetical protein